MTTLLIDGDLLAYGQDASEDVAPTLRVMNEVAIFKPSHFTRDKDGAPSDTHPPRAADADKGDQDPVLFDGVRVRRLTPLEYERLQGYPDNWTLIQYRGRPAADSPRYKACGNGYAANVVHQIGKRIAMVDKL